MSRKGKKKTTIVSTHRNKPTAGKNVMHATKKVRRHHKGYGMKNIVKGQMTFKRGSKKR
jgi:hypothetical protein